MVATRPPFCFVGFGTDRLRRQEAMKTAGRENPNNGVALPRNRAHGAAGQNKSRSITWAAKQETFQPKQMCFFDFHLYRTTQMGWRRPVSTGCDTLPMIDALETQRKGDRL